MSDESHPPSSQGSGSGRPAAWEPPSPEELQKLLPKYEIASLLGRGGMGAVYKGVQRSLERAVAIKILSAELDEREQGFAERFKNEARSMAKLNHPGIVGVHDFGQTAGGLLYIAMEFVAGTDVARMIAKQGRLPPDHAMAITAHVCDALAYAHGKGIIHRDIKPANIMVSYDGVVKVADFGLAKMTHSQNTGLTQSGMAMGTLHYMAPEALMLGTAVDHRADIYAVGVMLYQMLTGKLPQGMFDPPSKQIPGIDTRYDAIIAKAIRDDRELRYQSAGEMRADLDVILTRPVVHVDEGLDEAPPALPTGERPQRSTTVNDLAGRAGQVEESPPMHDVPEQPATSQQQPKPGKVPWLGLAAAVGILGTVLAFFFAGRGTKQSQTLVPPPAPAPVIAAARSPATRWPQDEHFRREGRFRIWSSLPNDPVVDLTKLRGVEGAAQVLLHATGWVVRLEDGSVLTSGGERFAGIRRVCHGWGSEFGLIDNSGKLRVMAGRKVPEDGPAIKDAFVSTPVTAVLREDGSLGVWGSGFDGKKSGTNTEWKEKPSVPAGRKAQALSASDLSLALLLDDGSLRVWERDLGQVTLPQAFNKTQFSFAHVNRSRIFAVDAKGVPYSWGFKDEGKGPNKPAFMKDAASLLAAIGGVAAIDKKGQVSVDRPFFDKARGVEWMLRHVGQAKPGLVTMYLSVSMPTVARLFWYDDRPLDAPMEKLLTDDPLPNTVVSTALATKERPFANTLGMKFVPVPIIGGPTHGKLVLCSVWETRCRDYAAFIREHPGRIWADPVGMNNVGDHCPALMVSWNDARDFCVWLTKKERELGVIGPKDQYRLPSDHEWSCAAGIGELEDASLGPKQKDGHIKIYEWGTQWPPPNDAANLRGEETAPWRNQKSIPGFRDRFSGLSPADSFPANRLGIRDLGGNVAEWCVDRDGANAVMRGSSWEWEEAKHTLSERNWAPVDKNTIYMGFRCVLEVPDGKAAPVPAPLVSKPTPSIAPTPLAPAKAEVSVLSLPEVRSRVANYQKTRHDQLADLAGKYRNALTAARDEAKKSGVQADVTELDAAIARANALADEIEKNLAATSVKPLTVLPPLGSHVPQRLKDLRAIFDRELVKIESTLVSALDQSLLVAQTDLVKASELDSAKALETTRKEIVAAFPKPVPTTLVETKPPASGTPTATSAVPAVAPTSVPQSSPSKAVTGRLRTWWQTPPKGDGPLGSLTEWKHADVPKQAYPGKVGDLTDFVAVHAADRGIVGIRSNGEAVQVISVYSKDGEPPDYRATTYAAASGARFVRFDRSGDEEILIDDKGGCRILNRTAATQAPGILTGVVDATSDRGVSHALLANHSLLWWGREYGTDPLNTRWPAPPVSARKDIIAISQSADLAAVLKQDGEPVAWNKSGGLSISSKAKGCTDVAACGRTVYALTGSGDVIVAYSSQSSRKGRVVLQNVAWIKPGGAALLAGLRSGLIVTDPETEKAEPSLKAILQVVGSPPPEAIDLHANTVEMIKQQISATGRIDLQLAWIEPVAPVVSPPTSTAPASGASAQVPVSTSQTTAVTPNPSSTPTTVGPAEATKDSPFINSLGMKFVPVPETKVLMCIHETRRQDYEVYAAANPGVNAEWKAPAYKHKPLSTAGDHPVVMVDRADVLAFCEWLTAREGVRYRLPTDREWSWAAGLGGKESSNGTPYSLSMENRGLRYWGEEWPPTKSNLGNYSDKSYKEMFANANAVGGGYADGHALTSPVMSFPPNRLGIYDLDGNVMERCQDFFNDPAGEKDLARGSYWAAWNPGQLLISHRETRGLVKRTTHCGFRVVIELP
ncbi:bifunctional serine/threonine-protein kinase/formylglycine-generating enzyme family protein [Prosthecobacter sp.]|uniref:bifunctional serine/threonine-protein kinase/formylglycine-generating enzyme family protein n=1 Tax=Prosthecobacter sp. TaxID=1965333 RepID=UPI001D1FBCF7|nr:bifunctional serine/threonine-protein kinase/formylglycine-generating enzyme family protein [Prosthecobacter sp.]MCB1279286.1 SUMF1/EgtB/PvdO family nonheme iron enzyme [Prosthecobacter sp.]